MTIPWWADPLALLIGLLPLLASALFVALVIAGIVGAALWMCETLDRIERRRW